MDQTWSNRAPVDLTYREAVDLTTMSQTAGCVHVPGKVRNIPANDRYLMGFL
jgi:hypothetical protein